VDDLIESVYGFWPADLRDRLHVLAALEELHTKRDGFEPQEAFEIGGEFGPVVHHVMSDPLERLSTIDTLFPLDSGTFLCP